MDKERKSFKKNPDYVNTGTRMLTAEDVKERLSIGINKARALMKRKDFPAIRLGGCVRVPEPEFEKWIHESVYKSYDV